MTAEPRPHIAGLKSFCQTQVDMTVGDKRLTFGTGPAVAPAIRLLLLYLGLPHSGRRGFRHQNRHAALNVYDLDVSEAFYREALGLSVARESTHPC
jgi:hypothetical protein